MLAWMYFSAPDQQQVKKMQAEQARKDSMVTDTVSPKQAQPKTASKAQDLQSAQTQTQSQQGIKPSKEQSKELGVFADATVKDTTSFVIKTPLYTAVFSNLGAGPTHFELSKYKTWDKQSYQLIQDTTRSAYSLGFISTQDYNIETHNILFRQQTAGNSFDLKKGETKQLKYTLQLDNGKSLTYIYTFHGGQYNIDLSVHFNGVSKYISSRTVDLSWQPPLNFSEKSEKQEARMNQAYVYSGGETDNLHIDKPGHNQKILNGQIRWVATKTKFFTQIIKPTQKTESATLRGQIAGKPETPGYGHNYTVSVESRIPQNNQLNFKLYLGPLRYNDLTAYDGTTYGMVYLGYSFMRFFSAPLVKYIIIPYFEYFGNFLGNFGIAIIIFGILVKLVLYPLTKKSFQSQAAMRELQPEVKELQDKYKSDPKKQQEEMMKLYKKAKVSPFGGCLPMLLQFPILITLWEFIQNSILIRQKSFLWAHDLSAPDIILHLPFHIPFLGDHLSGFVLLMALSMVGQMKVSGQTTSGGTGGAQMKIFMYIMPVMMLVIFNNLASGLNLYYLVYNVLSIGQQVLINRQMSEIDLLEKVDKKKAEELKRKKLIEQKKLERKSAK